MAASKYSIIRKLLQLMWFYVFIYDSLSDDCPHLCYCHGNRNLTVNCSGLVLVNPPLTSTSTLTLDLSNNALGPILNASFIQMRSLTVIDLSQNGLIRLLGCTFSGMLDLRTVRLRKNLLTSLPDSLFTDNNMIEHLDISFNFFTEIPDDVFRNIPRLKTLDVSHNQIAQLKFGIKFQVPVHIQVIDLSHNLISAIQSDAFAVASAWATVTSRTINMAFCRITSVENEAFSPIPNLNEIDLTGNSAVSMESLAALVKNLEAKGLERLSLAAMNLTTIVPLFSQVSELPLKFLNVSDNSIADLPDNVFSKLRNLRVLDLSRNSLSALTGGFSNLTNLNVLNLSRNVMESFQGEAVTSLSNLHTLDLSYNKISGSRHVNFSPLLNLNDLKVNNNLLNLAVLPNRTSHLRHLDYHSNKITEFNGIDDATMLEFVDLSNNELTSLPGLLFKGARFLKLVNFSRNHIGVLDHGAFLPQSSIVIDLSYNFLKELRYSNWVATQKLYINNNQLANIDNQAFYGMTGLEELNLSKNKLTTLHDDLFQYLTTLKLLNLSYNGLNIIQWFTLFRSLELLVNLDMGYNNISSLEEAMFLPLPNIQTVSLRNNRLRNIIPRTFQNLNEIKVIDFSNNPFDCSCDTLSFRDWLKKSSLPIHGLYAGNSTAYNCWTPYSRAGLHVTQWSSEQFECDKSMLYVIVFCTTFVILTAIGLLAAALYRLYVKWRNRKAEIKRELELEEERRKRAKKVDFVRMSEKKLVKDSYEGQEKQQMYENTDIRNGFVPWPGSVMTSGKAGNQGDKNIDNNRSNDHVKIVNRERERSKGKHYERVKRDEFVEGELDKKRLLGQDERRGRRTTAASQNELVDKRDLRIERAARRRESENSNAGVFHLQEASSHKGPSHYEAFARDPRKGRELDRPVYFDRHPQRQSSGPYIISSANTLPNRWVDNSRDWNLPQQWNNQDYRKPRNQDHRLNNYSYTSLPIWDNETPRYEREIALRNGVNDDHQMEAHFDETRQPNRNTRPDRDILDRRSPYHKRSQSHNIIPQDYAEWDQGAYEAIRQTRPRTANGHRAVSQPFLNNEEASEWL